MMPIVVLTITQKKVSTVMMLLPVFQSVACVGLHLTLHIQKSSAQGIPSAGAAHAQSCPPDMLAEYCDAFCTTRRDTFGFLICVTSRRDCQHAGSSLHSCGCYQHTGWMDCMWFHCVGAFAYKNNSASAQAALVEPQLNWSIEHA